LFAILEKELEITAELLGVQPKDLFFAISTKEIKLRTEIIHKPLAPEQARDQCDALAKHLYSVLFDWLVSQLNACTHADTYTSFIGVLDIFGFEVFIKNSLEQFLINFANEKLQQFFNHQIFKLEQKIYEEEKIDWTVIEFKDNQECLDLIEQRRPPGIIAILDEESRFPRATDETYIQKMTDNLKTHKYYDVPRLAKSKFIVKHFAGEVDYDVTGWLDKNKDELPPHLLKVLGSSENMFVAILYSPEDLPDPTGATGKSPMARRGGKTEKSADGPAPSNITLDLSAKPKGGPRGAAAAGASPDQKKAANKETLGTQFKNQLQDLMDLLGKTEPYFIRCVKPNPEKVPNNFNRDLIYNQLLYAGMLETIRIRRMGYPIRWLHDDFFKRFRVICPHIAPSRDSKTSANQLAEALKINMPFGGQIGLTKVFLKQEIANELEDRRNHALTHIIKLLQQWWRVVFERAQYLEYRSGTLQIQHWWRMANKRRKFVRNRKASIETQSWWRMIRAKKQLAILREKKRIEEEERRRREEEERLARIKKYGEEQVRREEELKAKLAAEQDDAEREKIRALLAGEPEKPDEEEGGPKKRKKKKRKTKDTRLSRTGSIMMDRNEIIEVPINVDGKMTVGLGWKGKKFEMDASCLMFRYRLHSDDVYKFKPRSKDGAVIHRVGWGGSLSMISSIGGEGSDIHQIDVNLKKLSNKINTLIFVVTLFTPGATFAEIEDAYCRLIDSSTKKEYCRYTIEASGKETAKIMCKLYRYGYTAWRLKAIGHPSQGRLYKHMISRVNPFLDAQPQKRRFSITIHKAKIQDNNKRRVYSNKTGGSSLNIFCETRFDLDAQKTRVVKKSSKPVWNATHEVEGCAATIEITLKHKKGFNKEVSFFFFICFFFMFRVLMFESSLVFRCSFRH
jgi:stress response protein SCP2